MLVSIISNNEISAFSAFCPIAMNAYTNNKKKQNKIDKNKNMNQIVKNR